MFSTRLNLKLIARIGIDIEKYFLSNLVRETQITSTMNQCHITMRYEKYLFVFNVLKVSDHLDALHYVPYTSVSAPLADAISQSTDSTTQ